MTPIIINLVLVLVIGFLLILIMRLQIKINQLKTGYTLLYSMREAAATLMAKREALTEMKQGSNDQEIGDYDPDDYTDLTSHQIKRIGERS